MSTRVVYVILSWVGRVMLSFEASSEHFLVDRNDRARGCRSGGGGARLSGLGGPTVRKKTFIRHTITRIRSILHGQLATNAIKSRRQNHQFVLDIFPRRYSGTHGSCIARAIPSSVLESSYNMTGLNSSSAAFEVLGCWFFWSFCVLGSQTHSSWSSPMAHIAGIHLVS